MVPEAAQENTPEGAEAFVRFYLDLVNEAWTTPATGLLPPLSDDDCGFCTRTEADARELAKAGHHFAKDSVESGSAKQVPAPSGQVHFEIEVTQKAVTIVDDSGAEVDRIQGATERVKVGVKWTDSGWRFLDLESLT
ncbi:hypothetical protein JQN72_10185 [Phycicoccus sp. CSK15P-2]|uniref:DUF6318 family protein n=1 Tax=Phycicoccus sp. CSK15P-2 TaxID=2807627 RepID=UPI001951FF98|nr:DUF6318 family protein [Phycicoccus sp. CSK15P-2]MBM6404608.1 hypothetical protein [Phycicoccus sp. CSK15P-2]